MLRQKSIPRSFVSLCRMNLKQLKCAFFSDMNNHFTASVAPEGVGFPRLFLSASQQQQLADLFHLQQQQQEVQQQLLYQNFQQQLQALKQQQQQQQHQLQVSIKKAD